MLTLFFIFCIIAVIVVLLVSSNNSKNKNSYTYSLVDASRNGYLEKIKLLIENGADFNIKNNDGKTALDLADFEEMKEILRKSGAK